jgi:single-strand DNA-binding protein
MNLAIISGRLGQNPVVRETSNGTLVCNLSIALDNDYTSREGVRVEREPTWVDIVVWGPQGEACAKFLKKGREITVEGSLETNKWEKEGKKFSKTRVKARSVQFHGSNTETVTEEAPAKKPSKKAA